MLWLIVGLYLSCKFASLVVGAFWSDDVTLDHFGPGGKYYRLREKSFKKKNLK